MEDGRSLKRDLLAALVRAGLVLALVWAVWGVYAALPHEEEAALPAAREEQRGSTSLRIILRRPTIEPLAAARSTVRLYPINMAAARSEYDSERRPGVRFEEFATRLMGGRQPLTVELDERGEAVVSVPPGRWWVHASVEGGRELTWRLPVNVTGRDKTVELTPENAYARAKRF